MTVDMMRACLPAASSTSVLLACGPPVMVAKAVAPAAEAMGYGTLGDNASRFFKF